MKMFGTREAAKKIGVRPGTLLQAVWNGRIKRPGKFGRSFVWSEEDIASAVKAFSTTAELKRGQNG